MGHTTPEIIVWYSGLFLQFAVCALAFRRRLYLRLPVFTSYLTVVMAREVFMYWVYHGAGYTSRLAFYSFWITQAVLLAGRAASIGELAWSASRSYAGFRAVLKWLLPAIALILLSRAVGVAMENASRLPSFVLTLERDVELTAAAILIALLAAGRRYQVHLESPQRLVAVGFVVYSLVQVLNNAISYQWLESYFHSWNVIRAGSFFAALTIWLVALARPLSAPADAPAPLDIEPLRDFMRQGTQVVHELAGRLRQFRKKLEK